MSWTLNLIFGSGAEEPMGFNKVKNDKNEQAQEVRQVLCS